MNATKIENYLGAISTRDLKILKEVQKNELKRLEEYEENLEISMEDDDDDLFLDDGIYNLVEQMETLRNYLQEINIELDKRLQELN